MSLAPLLVFANDTDVPLRGTLANGISYVVLRHASLRGELSARLVVQAGSFDESEDERGFAHLIQHLAADQLPKLASPAFRTYVQRFGLGDAHTPASYTHTTHGIDLTIGGAEQIDEVLGILRYFADELEFSSEQLASALPSVSRELEPVKSSQAVLSRQLTDLFFPGTRIPESDPAGVINLSSRATPERLLAFYRKNYLPNRMTVVVVGPVEGTAVVEKIERLFGTITAPAHPGSLLPPSEPPSLSDIKATLVTLPDAPRDFVAVELTSVSPRAPTTAEGRRTELIQSVAAAVFNTRVKVARSIERPVMVVTSGNEFVSQQVSNALALRPVSSIPGSVSDSSFINFSTLRPSWGIDEGGKTEITSSLVPGARLLRTSASASSVDGEWEWLARIIGSEIRRARTTGFKSEEIASAIASRRGASEQHAKTFPLTPSESLADDIAVAAGEGYPWETPAEKIAALQSLYQAEPAEFAAAFTRLFPATSAHLLLYSSGKRRIDPARVLAAFSKDKPGPVRLESSLRPPSLGQPAPSKPKAPVKQTEISELDLTLLTFGNGVRLNFRPGASLDGRIHVRIVFPKYWADATADLPELPRAAAYTFLSDPMRAGAPTLQTLYQRNDIRADFIFDGGTPIFLADFPEQQLELFFRSLEIRFPNLAGSILSRPSALSRFFTAENQRLVGAADIAFAHAVRSFAGNDRRIFVLPAQQKTSRVTLEYLYSWLNEHLRNAPFEIGVVGNIPVQRLVAVASTSVGTLENRPISQKIRTPLTGPKKALREDVVVGLPENLAAACVMWPVESAISPREDAAATLASEILRERLDDVLRSGFGVANSAEIEFNRHPVQRDWAFVKMLVYFPPPLVREFAARSVRLASQLAEKGATATEFSRARDAALARADLEMNDPEWWLREVVAVAQSRPDVLDAARQRKSILAALTLEEVNAAARVFCAERVTVAHALPQPVALVQRSGTKPDSKK